MTKKDYIAIAKAAADTREIGHGGTNRAENIDCISLDMFLGELCRILKVDNTNFDKARFLEACK